MIAIAVVALSAGTDDARASGGGATAHANKSKRKNGGRLRLKVSDSTPDQAIIDSHRAARFKFELGGTGRQDVVVRAIKVKSRKVVRHWRYDGLETKKKTKLRWNGKLNRRGFAGNGRYTFKVYRRGDHSQPADASRAKGKTRMHLHRNQFPIAAHHSYGDGFGAGRHHEGQDILTHCGKKIRAARGGRVQYKSRGAAAGNYLVIDGKGTGFDFVYMHMLKRGMAHQGDHVKTGQVIGYVGRTGDATACHLHFEMWSGPGWYEGGSPRPPTKALKKWDRYS